jgi:hydrogenase maturation protein HypF
MIKRLSIFVRGAVQGVGFRPFVYRIASELQLKGFVLNSSAGVSIEVEGFQNSLNDFLFKLQNEKPRLAIINSIESFYLPAFGYNDFKIEESSDEVEKTTLILPDFAVCDDCLKEMFDPNDRRYLYPFINCTNCGPRFSIIEKLPYDRPNTSMKNFLMCDDCRKEYENPTDRRFHAQPTACPVCGPQIELWDANGKVLAEKHSALSIAIDKIKSGFVLALKGLGGFQLIVNAENFSAVQKLRERKHRDEKPFALMFPSIESIKNVCEINQEEERILLSPESPIVIVKKENISTQLAENAAPNNPNLGVMLPYTPLHHLLMKELNKPIIATSGNLSEEPICIDNLEALQRLKSLADYFLVHNRPIVRHVDDSIVRVIHNRQMMMRRARGFAPLPITINYKNEDENNLTVLSVGAHLKNTVSLKVKNNIFISQHIGDLSTEESHKAFKNVINNFLGLYNAQPEIVVSDLHPDYLSTKYAKSINEDVKSYQHHYAHIASCRIENHFNGEALGVSWDGTGLGFDNSIWGGEFFHSSNCSYRHIAQFKKFKLPGGESAIKEPRRVAAGLLHTLFGSDFLKNNSDYFEKNFTSAELKTIQAMLEKNVNCPATSSVGRLFDAVSSFLNLCHKSNFEGQAAMLLEFAADGNEKGYYPFELVENEILIIDWSMIIKNILIDLQDKVSVKKISTKFHNSLVEIIFAVTKKFKYDNVILSGGCFQNKFLTERVIEKLESKKINVYWHQRVPPNDGGISLGQIAAYIIDLKNQKEEIIKNKISVRS